jgi:hypothetical protein
MQLKLEKLQKVASKVVNEEKRIEAFKTEVRNAIGPTVLVTHSLKLMAESANDQLDVLEKTGRSPGPVKTSTLLKFANSDIPVVRKLVARLLPEALVQKMMFDMSPAVRAAVANRLPRNLVVEMVRRFPADDQLMAVSQQKKLQESGLPTPKVVEKHFDLYGEFPLSDAYEGVEDPGFTDAWYDTQAHKIINGPTAYGNNLEGNWEEKTVDRLVDSYKSQGIEVDYDKLLKAVYKHMEIRDKSAIVASTMPKTAKDDMQENALKSIVSNLRFMSNYNPDVMPILEEKIDPVSDLLETKTFPSSYMKSFEDLFQVKKGSVANPGKSMGINENYSKLIVPVEATLPSQTMRQVDEKAVDVYVKHWNSRRNLMQQPYRLKWHPVESNTVRFQVELK